MNEELKEQLKQEIKQEMKQENKKKRKKKLIIVFIILLILVIWWIYLVYTSNSKIPAEPKIISQEEFSQYITEIPITIDNWKDYITLECETRENKNDFGEITSTTKDYQLKLKENVYGYEILKINIKNALFDPPFNNFDNERK